MNDYSHFAEDANRWEQTTEATWGSHDICPLLSQFSVMAISQSHLLAISWAKAWGDSKKPKLSMAYLLIAPAQTVEEERILRLVAMTGPMLLSGCMRILNMSPSLMQDTSASW